MDGDSKSPGKSKTLRSRTPATPIHSESKRARRSGTQSVTPSPSKRNRATLRRSQRQSSAGTYQHLYVSSSEDASPSPPPPVTRAKKVTVPKGRGERTVAERKKTDDSGSNFEDEEGQDSSPGDSDNREKIKKSFKVAVELVAKSPTKTGDDDQDASVRRSGRAPVPRRRLSEMEREKRTVASKAGKTASVCKKTPTSSSAAATRKNVGKVVEESTPDTPAGRRTRKKTEPSTETVAESTPDTSTLRRGTRKKAEVETKAEQEKATPDTSTLTRRRKKPEAKAEEDKEEPSPKTSTLSRPKRKVQAKTENDKEAATTPAPSTPKTVTKVQSTSKADNGPTPSRSSRRITLKANAEKEAEPVPRASRRSTVAADTESKASPAKPKVTLKSKPSTSKADQNTKVADKNQQPGALEWKFNVYGVPKCPLPCRELQFEEIWKFLFENITEKNSGCMYVSGVPGTGKTVIVQAVVDTMQKLREDKKKNINFDYLYINGLTLASPDKIWKRMFKGLDLPKKLKGISTKEALKRLGSYFESHQRNPIVLVVDELDQILDKQQSILYQLLEWSSHARNMFSFVAIFNTMSLPENGLAMRNYSRMGFKRAVFPPYSYDQLQTIVANMLSTFTTSRLNAECVSLLSRKVAAISGDARRALEIARRAMEIAEKGDLSGIQAVSNAFKEIFSSAKIETIKYTSLLEQLILKTICDEIRCSGVEEVLVAKIYENVVPKAVYEGMNWPKDEILKAMMRLAVMRVLIVEDNSTSLHKRVLLKVPVEDVNFALGIHTDLVA